MFLAGYLAASEIQENIKNSESQDMEQESVNMSERQELSGLSKSQQRRESKEELILRENQGRDCSKEGVSNSSQTEFKSGVSFAPNLASSTPKRVDLVEPTLHVNDLIRGRSQEVMPCTQQSDLSFRQGEPAIRGNVETAQARSAADMFLPVFEEGQGPNYNPTNWGYGWNPYNINEARGPMYRVENRGVNNSNFAHKC